MGKYDTGSKKVVNIYSQAWAEWVLQQRRIQVEAELSGDFQFVARANDSLLKVREGNKHFLALTELQFLFDKKMPERLAAYKLLARQKYNLDVFATVVYFLSPTKEAVIKTAYHNEFMGQLTHVDFNVIKLWELEASQVLNYNNPMLLPFAPLMQGGDKESVVRKCAERIRREAKDDAAELETVLAVFASYVLDVETVKQIVRWKMPIIRESPIIQELQTEWFEKGIERGLEKGIERGIEQGLEQGLERGLVKGERNTRIESIAQILTIRFHAPLGEFDEAMRPLSLEALKELAEVALTVDNLAQFKTKLALMKKDIPPYIP